MLTDKETLIIENDIIKHEGFRNKTYLDTLGYATGGIGHLITVSDKQYELQGTVIPMEVIHDWFYDDMYTAINDAEDIVDNYEELPFQVKRILINMVFNLGYKRLSKFKKMLSAIEKEDFKEAAKEMVDSRWYNQVGHRSKELVEMMNNV